MSTKSQPRPNDQRSDVKNPNNPARDADLANRASQGQGAPTQPTAPAQQPKK